MGCVRYCFTNINFNVRFLLSSDIFMSQGHLLFLDPWLVLSSLFLSLLLLFLLLSMAGFCFGASDVIFASAVAAFTVYLIITVASYRFDS